MVEIDTNQVIIFDTTLRDGEQSPGITFGISDKVAIATQLESAGVDVIEAGFPINEKDFESTQAVAASAGKLAVVCGLARANKADIESCWEAIQIAERPRIHTFLATSPVQMREKLRMSPDEVYAAAVDAVKFATEFTPDVEFSPEDATRSDFGFLMRVVDGAVEAGATTINIPDTTGHILPHEFAPLISQIVDRVHSLNSEVIVSAHCHDDLGNAVANSVAAIRGGARQVECTVNGIGERAGNAALEEIVANIIARPEEVGLETHIDTRQLQIISDMVARLSGYPVQYNKAVVGRNAFAHEAGIHQSGVIRDRSTYEILDAHAFGAVTTIVDGKHSGRHGRSVIDAQGQKNGRFSGSRTAEL